MSREVCSMKSDGKQMDVILESILGYGAFGVVNKCSLQISPNEKRDAARKTVVWVTNSTSETEEKFGKLRNLLKLDHENVVKTLHFGRPALDECEYGNILVWIFQEWCIGGTLFDGITSSPPKVLRKDTVKYTVQLLNGLNYLHTLAEPIGPVIHGDMKSENIFLTSDYSVVKIGDLDDNIQLSGPTTSSSDVKKKMGTLRYMSPEMILCRFDESKRKASIGRKTDIWSLGCVVLDMTCGDHWTINRERAINLKEGDIQMYYEENPESHPEIPEQLRNTCRDFLEACFRRSPDGKFGRPTAKQLLEKAYLDKKDSLIW